MRGRCGGGAAVAAHGWVPVQPGGGGLRHPGGVRRVATGRRAACRCRQPTMAPDASTASPPCPRPCRLPRPCPAPALRREEGRMAPSPPERARLWCGRAGCAGAGGQRAPDRRGGGAAVAAHGWVPVQPGVAACGIRAACDGWPPVAAPPVGAASRPWPRMRPPRPPPCPLPLAPSPAPAQPLPCAQERGGYPFAAGAGQALVRAGRLRGGRRAERV